VVVLITGSEGNIGRRLRHALGEAVGLDRARGADIVADLGTIDYGSRTMRDALAAASAIVHLATSPDPHAADPVQWQDVANAARLFAAAAAAKVPKLVAASSPWAEPGAGMQLNGYARAKRAIEALCEMYGAAPGRSGVAVRVGWVPHEPGALGQAPDWLRANFWDDARLVAEFRAALGV
jgi:nucleoside-diphosphate-sugar epimerase